MFLARRPSPEHIDRFLRESQVLPLSYSPTGIVKANTVREDLDEATVVIGHGKAAFERARAALMTIDPQTDEVIYRIRAVSWPQAMLARIGQPIVRVLQERFREHSAAAMMRAIRERRD